MRDRMTWAERAAWWLAVAILAFTLGAFYARSTRADDLDLPVEPGAPVTSATVAAGRSVSPGPVLPPPPPLRAPEPPPVTPPPTIYGRDLQSETATVVYVIDISGSMGWDVGQYTKLDGTTAVGCRMDRAKVELDRSIRSLPRSFRFDAESYDCGTAWWAPALREANAANKADAIAWVDGLVPSGGTGTGPAVASALAAPTKLIVLLTDGAPNCGVADDSQDQRCLDQHRRMIREHDQRHVPIDVFGVGATGAFRQFCLDVASDSGGSYTDVR